MRTYEDSLEFESKVLKRKVKEKSLARFAENQVPVFNMPEIEKKPAKKELCTSVKEAKCLHCGETFQQKKSWQTFCTSKHRDLYHNTHAKLRVDALEKEIQELREKLERLESDHGN